MDGWLLQFLGKEAKLIARVAAKYGLPEEGYTAKECASTGDLDDDSKNLVLDSVKWANGDLYNGTWKIMPVFENQLPKGGLGNHPPKKKASAAAAGGVGSGGAVSGLRLGADGKPVLQRKMHGAGTFKYASGDFYQGDFRNGMRHGYGELVSSCLVALLHPF